MYGKQEELLREIVLYWMLAILMDCFCHFINKIWRMPQEG